MLDQIEKIRIGTIDIAEPGEGEVLVQIKAAGVNPVDAAVRNGYLKNFLARDETIEANEPDL